MMISRMGDKLIGEGNPQLLWDMLKDIQASKPKYRESVILTKAKAASAVGEYDLAWPLLQDVANEGKAPSSAEALIEMGTIKSLKGEIEAASGLFYQAMEQCSEHPSISAKALRGLGVVEGKLGNYAKAQELLERSAKEAMTGMDSKGMLMAHLELGNVFIGQRMYEQAIDHFSKCAAGFGPVQLTNVYMNMGIANVSLGRDNEARVNLENAVRLADETGQPRSKAYALNSLAEVLIRSGQVESAKEHSFRALDIVTDLGDKIGISSAYANLGLAEKTSGNLHDSEEYYEESIVALENTDTPLVLGTRKMELGLLLKERGQRQKARGLLQDSRGLFKRQNAADMVARVESELKTLE